MSETGPLKFNWRCWKVGPKISRVKRSKLCEKAVEEGFCIKISSIRVFLRVPTANLEITWRFMCTRHSPSLFRLVYCNLEIPEVLCEAGCDPAILKEYRSITTDLLYDWTNNWGLVTGGFWKVIQSSCNSGYQKLFAKQLSLLNLTALLYKLGTVLRATTACIFLSLIWPDPPF